MRAHPKGLTRPAVPRAYADGDVRHAPRMSNLIFGRGGTPSVAKAVSPVPPPHMTSVVVRSLRRATEEADPRRATRRVHLCRGSELNTRRPQAWLTQPSNEASDP